MALHNKSVMYTLFVSLRHNNVDRYVLINSKPVLLFVFAETKFRYNLTNPIREYQICPNAKVSES